MTCYSYSRISTFEQCKYKYKLQYIDRIRVEVPTTVEMFMGNLVHQVLEKLYKDLKYNKKNSKEELLNYYNSLWEKKWSDDIIIVKGEYSQQNYKEMGQKYISDYYETYEPFDDMQVLALETQDRLTLPDGNQYHVRIDKLTNKGSTYYIVDYKTNNRMKSQEEADEDKQLAMYSIWVKNHFPDAKEVILKWHMLAFNKEAVSKRTEEQLEKLQSEIVGTIKKIELTKEYPRNVTALCDYCVYKSMCPSFKHQIQLEENELKEDDGKELADKYSELDKKEKEIKREKEIIKNKLIVFAKDKDVDMVYGKSSRISLKRYEKIIYPEDKEMFMELLKQKGVLEKVSIISYPRLSSMVLKNELDQEIIDQVRTEEAFRISVSHNNLGL